MLTEEEERDFETFTLASPNALKRKTLWRASQENTKFYSLAQQGHRQDDLFTSQARFVDSQALSRDQVNQVQDQAQHLLDQASFNPGQACRSGSVSSPVASRSRSATSNFGCGDLESLYDDEIFPLELDNEAALRENQARLEAAKEGITGMKIPVYNVPGKKSIELSLPWYSPSYYTLAKPWGPKEFFSSSGYYTHNAEGYAPKPESLFIPSRE